MRGWSRVVSREKGLCSVFKGMYLFFWNATFFRLKYVRATSVLEKLDEHFQTVNLTMIAILWTTCNTAFTSPYKLKQIEGTSEELLTEIGGILYDVILFATSTS